MATYKFQARKLWSWRTFRDFMDMAAAYGPAKAEISAKLEALRDQLRELMKVPGVSPARYFYEAALRLLDRLFQRRG